jgi:disulfide bond formation protein DsbB
MVFGAAFFIGATHYSLGTAARMGPGYFPRVLAGILFILGIIIALEGAREVKKGEQDHIGWHVMPMVYLLGAIGAFGIILPKGGLVLAALAIVCISATAAMDKKWKEISFLAVGLAVFCVLAFVKGLGLQMKIFPWS